MRSTNGKGVDVVLNSLAGEALRQTWECIAMFGRFIEIGKKDILANSGLEMMPFLRNVTFAGVNLEVKKSSVLPNNLNLRLISFPAHVSEQTSNAFPRASQQF